MCVDGWVVVVVDGGQGGLYSFGWCGGGGLGGHVSGVRVVWVV